MINPDGTPIWYELLTPDADAAGTFYAPLIGWTIAPAPGPTDYRILGTGHGEAGGMLALSPEMIAGGARPTWLVYVGVHDVDASVAAVTANGGAIHMPAMDVPGVGRMAMVADPQGNPFYVMRGASDQPSRAWDRAAMAKCNWNELVTPDPDAALAFYAAVFGWTYPDRMTMPGDMGDYVFVEAGGETIGAIMRTQDGAQGPGWHFYFRVADIDAAAAALAAQGGTLLVGPDPVPGGERVLLARDPQGATFGLVGPA